MVARLAEDREGAFSRGSSSEPKRTSTVRCTTPPTTQRSERDVLSTHIARPVTQRGSRAGPAGTMLKSSALVGSRVISLSRESVRRSTSPVTGIFRLAWKPCTALTVERP